MASAGFGKTTVSASGLRQAFTPMLLSLSSAKAATDRQSAAFFSSPSFPHFFSAYHKNRGVIPLRDPDMVVSSEPIYDIVRPMRSLYDFFTTTTPQVIGEPINLCPLMATLSAPWLKSKLSYPSKGR